MQPIWRDIISCPEQSAGGSLVLLGQGIHGWTPQDES